MEYGLLAMFLNTIFTFSPTLPWIMGPEVSNTTGEHVLKVYKHLHHIMSQPSIYIKFCKYP